MPVVHVCLSEVTDRKVKIYMANRKFSNKGNAIQDILTNLEFDTGED